MAVRKMQPKAPNWVDAYVGSRVQFRRKQLGLSQEKLGEALGITFQQVQKYEKGINRIGASRLVDIAKCLDTPVSFFFPKDEADSLSLDRSAEPIDASAQLAITPEAVKLVRLFSEITDPDLRKNIVSLVTILSEQKQNSDTKN